MRLPGGSGPVRHQKSHTSPWGGVLLPPLLIYLFLAASFYVSAIHAGSSVLSKCSGNASLPKCVFGDQELSSVRGAVQPLIQLTLSPTSSCPPQMCVCVCVHGSRCLFLYSVLFFHCLRAVGLEAKHLLNCCQARKWVIKLPREEIDGSGVERRERVRRGREQGEVGREEGERTG